jgi:hypothetical protein
MHLSVALSIVWLATSHVSIAESISADVLSQVPLQDDGVAIRVPVELFEKTCYFGIDTGSTSSTLDTSYREKLGKPLADGHLHTPLSSGGQLPVYA